MTTFEMIDREEAAEAASRDRGDLCVGCEYWVPTVGALCESCAGDDVDRCPPKGIARPTAADLQRAMAGMSPERRREFARALVWKG